MSRRIAATRMEISFRKLIDMKYQNLVLHALALLAFAPRAMLAQPTVSAVASAPASAVAPGQSITMTVSASGSSLAYQCRPMLASFSGSVRRVIGD